MTTTQRRRVDAGCPVYPSKRLLHFAWCWCRKICIKCKWCQRMVEKWWGGKLLLEWDELPRLPLWLFVVLCDIIFIKRIIGASLAYPVIHRTPPTGPPIAPFPISPIRLHNFSPFMQINNGCLLFQVSNFVAEKYVGLYRHSFFPYLYTYFFCLFYTASRRHIWFKTWHWKAL